MIDPLTTLTLKGERDLLVEAGSPFREPLIKFLLRYPQPTVDLFLSDTKIKDQQWNRCFEVSKQETGIVYRAHTVPCTCTYSDCGVNSLIHLILTVVNPPR